MYNRSSSVVLSAQLGSSSSKIANKPPHAASPRPDPTSSIVVQNPLHPKYQYHTWTKLKKKPTPAAHAQTP